MSEAESKELNPGDFARIRQGIHADKEGLVVAADKETVTVKLGDRDVTFGRSSGWVVWAGDGPRTTGGSDATESGAEPRFQVGEKVRVKEGPLTNKLVTVISVDEQSVVVRFDQQLVPDALLKTDQDGNDDSEPAKPSQTVSTTRSDGDDPVHEDKDTAVSSKLVDPRHLTNGDFILILKSDPNADPKGMFSEDTKATFIGSFDKFFTVNARRVNGGPCKYFNLAYTEKVESRDKEENECSKEPPPRT